MTSSFRGRISAPIRLISHSGSIDVNSQSASAELFVDAEREEAEERSSPPQRSLGQLLNDQNENWTGEERIQDALLRMLMDKYKPLRSRTVQSAEQKLKRNPPAIHTDPTFLNPSGGSWASESLIPSTGGHRPWHTEFKIPSHATASVKAGNIPPPTMCTNHSSPEKAAAINKALLKRIQQAGRLDRARESTLDYRLGIKKVQPTGRVNPVTVKGWAGLVEDRIEQAKLTGLFKTVKGRGQPLNRSVDEHNPFIAREEFFMNRIVQRNGAVPPWVQLQGELDTALSTFREVLRQGWIRRAVLNLTTDYPFGVLARFTMHDIRSLRDKDWECKEESYHDTALEEVNSLVRRYNGLAPYAVRRGLYSRRVELDRAYQECAEEILQRLAEREEATASPTVQLAPPDMTVSFGLPRLRDILRAWIAEVRSAFDYLSSQAPKGQ